MDRRTDALFELTDAILTADATVPSPAHSSPQPPHRRGWGRLYAALSHGRIGEEALRKLLARHPLAQSGATPVYAVDVSVWDRCDAEASPERGYYYRPSRHSAGQPIVAGWAYQFVAQLNFVRESWTALVDVERVRPTQDTNEVAAQQIEALLGRLEEGEAVPLIVFDAGYDPVIKVQRGLEGSPCQILVRLRAGRRFYGDPGLCDPPEHIGRPRRHGPKKKCNDPSTWPEPSTEQSGIKARDVAVLGGVLALYDLIATSLLPLMIDLITRLASFPFAPVVSWGVGPDRSMIGIGDLLLATVFPLAMRKSFGR